MPHKKFEVNGEAWPSVTEIIGCLDKPWKERWHRKVGFQEADRISQESRDLGTACHKHVELYFDWGTEPEGDTKDVRLFKAWLSWWNSSPYEFVSQEQHLVCKSKRYHGTYDCLITDGKKLVLADWKFSKNTDGLRPVQLGGYSYAFNENFEEKVSSGLIVRVDPVKETVAEPKYYRSLKKYEKAFLALRKAFDINTGKYFDTRRVKKAA